MRPHCILIAACIALSSPAARADRFFWGVSNSAFQAEGSPADSDWNRWVRGDWHTEDGTNADVATDFWNRYSEDFALARKIGLNAFRISIAWERIEPFKNQWDEQALDHYAEMLESMRRHGLEPVVTLYHFPLPVWQSAEGGALSPEFESEFAKYARHVASRLKSVRYWITFNEPLSVVNGGYVSGWWPPEIKGGFEGGLKAQEKFARAHVAAAQALHALKHGRKLKVGIAQAWQAYLPRDPSSESDRSATAFVKWLNNEYLVGLIAQAPGSLDFIGVNYYTRYFVKSRETEPFYELDGGTNETTELGWEICPDEMELALQDASKFGVPVMITENGLGDSKDAQRAEFIRRHIETVKRVRARGLRILGYLHWSLTDNFEWGCGLACRFGLVEIDYEHGLARKPRPSYFEYGKLIREAGF